MIMFKLKTSISKCDSFAEFAKEFNLNEKDLVITQSFIYTPFMEKLGLPCHFIMQDKYGAGEPSDEMMNNILNDLRGAQYDRVIGVGGGTVIDISKLFVLKNLTNATEAFERKIPIEKEKSLIIVPTTCGTGSEVTNISIAEIKSKHTKLGLADDAIVADNAVMIPELLSGLPYKFYIFSAIDALIHATESFVSPKASPYTKIFSKEAIHLIMKNFAKLIEKGPDFRLECMDEMLIASNFAGIAFGNAGCGAVHALSYPLGGNYHVPHGEANYQFFTDIFKFYCRKDKNGRIVELNTILADELGLDRGLVCSNPEAIYDKLGDMLNNLIEKHPLHHFGMKQEEIESFTDNVIATQQRLLGNNYVPMSRDEIKEVYSKLY